MIGYRMACKVYGIKPLTEEEQKQTTINEKTIRECKINIINMCNEIRKGVDLIDALAVNAIEEDNQATKDKLVALRSEIRRFTADFANIVEKEK